MHKVIFTLDFQQFGIDLFCVNSVIRAVEITTLPTFSEEICGVINMQGKMVPVIAMRKIFNLSIRPVEPSDQFIICNSEGKLLALWVDGVKGVVAFDAALKEGITSLEEKELEEQVMAKEKVKAFSCIAKSGEKITLIYDIQKLFANENLIKATRMI